MSQSISRKGVLLFIVLLGYTASVLAQLALPPVKPLLVEVVINTQPYPKIIACYYDRSGKVWLNDKQLTALRLQLPKITPRYHLQTRYYQLEGYPKTTYLLDQSRLKLLITTAASNFVPTRLSNTPVQVIPTRSSQPGGFFNYQLAAMQHEDRSHFSALGEIGYFNPFGVGITNFLFAHRRHFFEPRDHLARLETTWIVDQPETMTTWRFGDAITSGADWSGAVRFGGIQYATNFRTQPRFVTFPLPSVRGEAIVPSMVNVLVDNVLHQSQAVNSGPFVLNNVPVMTGAGTMQIVTKDILGQSQVVTIPYYTSPLLLKAGLSSFSYEAGWMRYDYGIVSNRYRHLLASGNYQRGITDKLTVGVQGAWLQKQQTIGLSSDYLWDRYGIVSLALAGSRFHTQLGALASLGFIRQADPLSFGIKSTINSEQFAMLGLPLSDKIPRKSALTTQAFISYGTPTLGSLGINYLLVKNDFLLGWGKHWWNKVSRRRATAKLLTVTYHRSLFSRIAMTIGGTLDVAHSGNNQLFASFTINLETDHFVNLYAAHQYQQGLTAVELAKNLPLGNGYGYRMVATNQAVNYFSGEAILQNDIGRYTARIYGMPKHPHYEADIQGGSVYLDHQFFLTRPVTSSFTVVSIPHYRNIRVYYENQEIGRTNRHGNVLITQLLPYEQNKIVIEPLDFPLNTRLPFTEKVVVPYFKSGVLADFPVKALHSFLLHFKRKTGQAVPVGSIVSINQKPQITYPVGYEGQVYLPDVLSTDLTGQVQWEGGSCPFAIHLPIERPGINQIVTVFCQREEPR